MKRSIQLIVLVLMVLCQNIGSAVARRVLMMELSLWCWYNWNNAVNRFI